MTDTADDICHYAGEKFLDMIVTSRRIFEVMYTCTNIESVCSALLSMLSAIIHMKCIDDVYMQI